MIDRPTQWTAGPARAPRRRSLLLLALSLFAAAGARAQEPAHASTDADPRFDSAEVVLDGVPLFEIHGIRAFPAARRAASILTAIRDAAEDPNFDPATLAVVEGEADSRLVGGTRTILRVVDVDAEFQGVDRRILAEIYLSKVSAAIVDYRAARTTEALVASAWKAAVATLLVVVALFVLTRVLRGVDRRVEARFRSRMQAVTIRSFEVVRAERLWRVVHWLLGMIGALLIFGTAYLYLRYVLALLPWTRGAGARLDDWLLAPLLLLGRGLLEQLPDLAFLAVLFVLVRLLLRLVHLFFAAVGRGEVELSGFDPDWADPTYKLVRLGVVAFSLVVAYPYIPGSSSDAFKGISLFIGVVFSLGSTSAIANLLAGYMLTYRRAFREGDRVKIAGIVGDVTKVRLQATYLRTVKNEEVVVPNSTILGGEVVNYSTLARDPGLILHTTVGIGYETPWRQVEAMLLESARRTPGLLAEPKPFVLQLALADFAVTYEINAYCDDPRAMGPLYSALHRSILDVFNEYGVQIMTPAYETDPEIPKVVPKEQWHLPPAAKP